MTWRSLALLLALSAVGACDDTPARPCPFEGEADFAPSAGCLTVVHGRMLVVEATGGGVTPPGGSTRKGESAQCAAHREALEETGLDLVPGELMRVFDTGFHLYVCSIHADSGRIEPNAFAEVRRGFWLPVEEFSAVEWRYPGQGEQLYELLTAPYEDGEQSAGQAAR